ncbi:MAG TPA: hypothetical protein VHO27_16955 [Angustibacter sp.]|nr:hypothetical protein [Angustibacter sp.]
MATDMHDPLHEALSGLRDDVSGVSLAPADSVRHRGDQRTRHRRIGVTAVGVAAVAAIAVVSGQLGGPSAAPRPVPPASSSSPTASASPSPTSASAEASTPATRPTVRLTPASPGGGAVPAAYFLPGQLWQGPDLNSGHRLQSVEPYETEGSVTRFECDPDTDIKGAVAFLQVRDTTTQNIVGTQKVRLLASPDQAAAFADAMAAAMTGCQDRLRAQAQVDAGPLPPGETAPTPNATVEPQASSTVDDAAGSVRVFRTSTDYGTGASSALTQWVVLAREGSAVTFLSLPQLEGSSVTLAALQRLAEQARLQIRWAATQ